MRRIAIATGVLALMTMGCQKVSYNKISNPAYLRVFNSLNYAITEANKDAPPPFLTMIIDPVFDATGTVSGGSVTGDYLAQRVSYAPPYPQNTGSTATTNYEYPGSEKVLAGPILNGFDLSSWAQIASGKHRIQFYNRTVSDVPFFQLPATARKSLLVDTTLTLTQGEVYTMEILQKDIYSNPVAAQLYIRDEQFPKMGLADSLLYVNFYNLSAAGYCNAYSNNDPAQFDAPGSNTARVIRDSMNIYYCLYTPDSTNGYAGRTIVPNYRDITLTTLIRSQVPGVAPYYSIPIFPGKDTTGGIYSHIWEQFVFLLPGLLPTGNGQYGPYSLLNVELDGNFAKLDCTQSFDINYTGSYAISEQEVPNLIVRTASGVYANRSFATVSSIEWINNRVYLMSIQRQYPAPVRN